MRRSKISRFTRLSAVVLVSTTVSLALPSTVLAYTGDGSNPSSCSSPVNLRTAGIFRNGVKVGETQLRFSDPCDRSWNRTCAATGYIATFGIGERFVAPSTVGIYYTDVNQGSNTNNCSGTGLTGPSTFTKAWFNDCQEAGLGTCRSRAAGQVLLGSNPSMAFSSVASE